MLESKKSILLVEDEAIIAATTAKVLSQDFDVQTVLSGERAIELVKGGEKIDMILMDINLGRGMDGTEAAEIILRERNLPIVFLSSHVERAVVEKAERITSYGYVLKNPGSTVLFASIRMAFRLFEARRAISENLNKCRLNAEWRQSALNSASIGIWELDLQKNRLTADENMLRLLGLGRADAGLEAEHWKKLVHPDDLGRLLSALPPAQGGEREFDQTFRIVRGDGSLQHVRAFGKRLRDGEGDLARMTGVCYGVAKPN